MTFVLLVLLLIGGAIFAIVFFKDYRAAKKRGELETKGSASAIGLTGFWVCFFDTLGLGGFAPLTAAFNNFIGSRTELFQERLIRRCASRSLQKR